MKVLQVVNNLATGGAEKLIFDSIPIHIKKGIKVELLLLNGKDYPLLKKLKGDNICKIHDFGVKTVYNPIHIFKLLRFISKYDLIHVHLFPSQYWVVFAKLLSFSKVKLIFTEHSTFNKRLRNKWFNKINKFVYKKYDRIVCITKEVQEIYLDYTKLDKEKFPVIENGINNKLIHNAIPYEKENLIDGLKREDKLIIQVSSFREAKDQITLIRSMKYLSSNTKLLLVGEGNTMSKCKDLVSSLNLKNRVFFLGLRDDIPELLVTSDIVVLSSHYEGLSLSCIEGMSSGKPFVGSKVPGLIDVVEGNGILFPLGDYQKLASIITELLNNEKLYKETVMKCKEKAAHYDIEIMVDKYIDVYRELLIE